MLSAFAVDTALVLAHIEIDEKSNEIPAAKKLMEELHLAGHIVTCDAMHCQKNFEAAAVANAHLIVQLKENQPILWQKVEAVRHGQAPVERADRGPETAQPPRNPSHRGVTAAPAVAGTEWEPHVAAIIKVERAINVRQPATGLWKPSSEISFYLSGRPVTANLAAHAIRKHWGIENKSHYTRDVTFREDASRIRTNPGIVARLRSIAYNILRCNQSDSIPQDRFATALGGLKSIFSMTFSRER